MEKGGAINKLLTAGAAVLALATSNCDASKASQLEEERGRVKASILMGLGLHEEGVLTAGPETASAIGCGEGDDENAAYRAAFEKAHAFVREAMGLQESGLSYYNEEVGNGAVGKEAISCVESTAHSSPAQTKQPGAYEKGVGVGVIHEL